MDAFIMTAAYDFTAYQRDSVTLAYGGIWIGS